MPQKITEESVKKFTTEVKNACPSLISRGERDILNSIPPEVFEQVLRDVFSGDVKLARDIMTNRYDLIDFDSPEDEVRAIRTMAPASETLSHALAEGSPLLLISDTDNDGNLAQGIMMAAATLGKYEGVTVESKEYNAANHGFSIEQIESWLEKNDIHFAAPFSVVISDLGTNQKTEQKEFILRFPNANLIVADHHQPDIADVMKFEASLIDFLDANRKVGEPGVGFLTEYDVNRLSASVSPVELEEMWQNANANREEFISLLGEKVNVKKRSFLVSPFSKGSMNLSLRSGGGVSGAFLVYTLMSEVLKKHRDISEHLKPLSNTAFQEQISTMREMGRAANLFDVECDIRLKPLHEKDISKALGLGKITGNGRSLSKWIRPSQRDKIKALEGFIGLPAVEELLDLQETMVKENHTAAALFHVLPKVLNDELDDNGKVKKVDIRLEIMKYLNENNTAETVGRNFTEELRPHIFNFNYENQLQDSKKKPWLSVAERVLKNIGIAEKEILTVIREHQLISEISLDYAMITRPISPEVESVFTDKQLTKAYHSLGKAITMSVTSTRKGQITLSMKSESEVSISDVLFGLGKELDFITPTYRGHSKVGGLTLKYDPVAIPSEHALLKRFTEFVNSETKRIIDAQPIPKSFELTTTHLKVVKEMMEVMRVHLNRSTSPSMIMRLTPDMTFEDKDTLRKLSVSDLAKQREWEVTNEFLDFGMTSSLMLPNQALKSVSNDGYRGAVGLTLLPNGTFIANKIFTGEQLAPHNIPKLATPLDAEREELKQYYIEHFMNKALPVKKYTRKEGIEALKFTMRPEDVFNNGEALALSLMREKGADSYAVLDVEADGAGNAPCFEIGIFVMKPIPGSGTVVEISPAEFEEKLKRNPRYVRNWYKNDDQKIIVNERMSVELLSLVISKDGSQPIRVSFKSKNLTNMDQPMIDEIGCTAEHAQNVMVDFLKGCGKFIIQAHNLPYDDNIVRVNFPELHKMLAEGINLDSAPFAKNHQIAYMNLRVNKIGGYEFFNAEHRGYNLNTKLDEEENFDFPSIKGDGLLKVRGDEVFVTNMSTRITTKLKMNRTEMVDLIAQGMSKIEHPRYSIAKLLRMATIHDMIKNKPVKKLEYVSFDSLSMSELPPKLWKHFQDYYAFDMTPAQNVAKFSVMPGVQELLGEKISFGSPAAMPDGLLESKLREAGDEFKMTARMSKKAKEEIESAMRVISYSDMLKFNAEQFVKSNPENAERYALAWAYEMVLEHHEVTTKHVPASFIAGVYDMIGIDPSVVKQVYADMHEYKTFRGIQSYVVHEPHSNFNLSGDNYQEYMVVAHLGAEKVRNPFMTPAICFRTGLNPVGNIVEQFSLQAVESSMKQYTRQVAGVSMDSTDLVNASAKQLMNQFSSDGISIANDEKGAARFKCRSTSKDSVDLQVIFPDYDPNDFISMGDEERDRWKNDVEKVITALLLSNSLGKADKSISAVLRGLATSPDVIETMKAIEQHFGNAVPTEREAAIKKFMGNATQAILGKDAELKFPINKHLNKDDLKEIARSLFTALDKLQEHQNFIPYINKDDVVENLDIAYNQYLLFDELKRTGDIPSEVNGYQPEKTEKAQLTIMAKLRNEVMQIHLDAYESFASSLLTKKNDPLKFVLESDLKNEMIDFVMPEGKELKLNNEYDGVDFVDDGVEMAPLSIDENEEDVPREMQLGFKI